MRSKIVIAIIVALLIMPAFAQEDAANFKFELIESDDDTIVFSFTVDLFAEDYIHMSNVVLAINMPDDTQQTFLPTLLQELEQDDTIQHTWTLSKEGENFDLSGVQWSLNPEPDDGNIDDDDIMEESVIQDEIPELDHYTFHYCWSKGDEDDCNLRDEQIVFSAIPTLNSTLSFLLFSIIIGWFSLRLKKQLG